MWRSTTIRSVLFAGRRWTSRIGAAGAAALVAALLLAPGQLLAQGPTTTRPISDFLSTQGTYCVANPSACPDFLGTYVAWTAPGSGRIAQVDFAAKEPVAGQLGTATSGSVTERRLADGRAEVHVSLRTRNAMTYVLTWDGTTDFDAGAPLFGHTTAQIQGGAAAGVGDSQLDVRFTNSAPGAALPDLVRFVTGDASGLNVIGFQASAFGPLRPAFGAANGTPGRAQITQKGLIAAGGHQGFHHGFDGFPVEHINLSVVGR
jgi:hypothetical protein